MAQLALVIDDNAMNLETLAVVLRLEGLTVLTLQSARELPGVLDQLDNLKVVFLDLEFPNDNGFRILEMLRMDERFAAVPIVAYTVHISEQNEARAAGFHSFLGKPINISRFPEQLRRILANEPVWEVG